MTRTEVVSKARRAPALRRAPVAAVRALVAAAQYREEEAGTALFEEGEPGESVYLILRGSVRITKDLGGGETALIATRERNEWIGELALRPGEARSASATVGGRSHLLEVPTREFVALLTDHPAAALDILSLVSERLRESDRGMIEALQKRTEELIETNENLGQQVRRFRAGHNEERGFEAFVGRSADTIRVRKAGARASRAETPTLLLGEQGVGKALLARCIHDAGPGAEAAFVSVDCSLFESPLLEAEMFGHARGALPGARKPAAGAVERADGGTLYLSRIDTLPRPVQAMLFRFLELGEFQRVGESRVRTARLQLVASATEDPASQTDPTLREDLVARVAVQKIQLLPLRKRRADVPLLAARLSEDIAADLGVASFEFEPSALRVLSRYDYPENVLELRAELEALYQVAKPGSRITSRDLSAKFVQGDASTAELYSEAVRAFKAQIIANAVHEAGGHRSRAAERLGLHPSNLSRMVRELELDDVL